MHRVMFADLWLVESAG